MCRKKCFAFMLVALMSTLLFQCGCSNQLQLKQQKAMEGSLDLMEWPLDKEIAGLDGEWEFYWGQLLDPGQLKESRVHKTGYISIPGSWNRYIVSGKELSGSGYATYRLVVKLTGESRLGIKIPRIFTAYRLWVNEELVASAGDVGTNRETMRPQYLPQIALFEAQRGENEIVIQVSNFYHRSGGVLESLKLGSESQILEMRDKGLAGELFLLGGLIMLGAYHLALFFFRKKDYSSLYFGIFCVLVGLRTLLVGERFLSFLFPSFSWEVAHKIQTLAFYLGVPIILMFFRSIFPNDFSYRILRVVQVVGAAFGCLVLFTPAKIFTVFNPVYQVITVLIIIYIVGIFIKKISRKDDGIGLIVAGAMALILTSINDIVFLSIWMNDYNLPILRSIFRTASLSRSSKPWTFWACSLAKSANLSAIMHIASHTNNSDSYHSKMLASS
jgi:hypothetical protein